MAEKGSSSSGGPAPTLSTLGSPLPEGQSFSHPKPQPSRVIVHPVVLLSVVDHFTRMRKLGQNKRVVGILLGSLKSPGFHPSANIVPGSGDTLTAALPTSSSTNGPGGAGEGSDGGPMGTPGGLTGLAQEVRGPVLDVSNCFAVPFDEDDHDTSVWFLDHDFLEGMYAMFKKVNARERIVGWYHSGPKLRPNDLAINELIRKYNTNSVLVVVDVEPKLRTLPTEAYLAVDLVHDDGTPTSQTFNHLPSEIAAEEAEEVGVEHLLREVKSASAGTLSQHIAEQLYGLSGLHRELARIGSYLRAVSEGRLPVNHSVILLCQQVLNLLPDLQLPSLQRAGQLYNNDALEVMYICAMVRSILSLHDLINNKLANREAERTELEKDKEGKEKDKEKEKEKDEKDKEKEKDKDGKEKDKGKEKEKGKDSTTRKH